MKVPGRLGRLIASKAGSLESTAASSQDTSASPTFTPFPRLPAELRAAIWRAALPCDLHITELRIYNKSITPCLSAHTIFSVNRESRAEAFAVLLNAPPPYSLPTDPQRDTVSLDPRVWNDLPHMSVGKTPLRAAVIEADRAHRFIAAALVDSDQGRFGSLPVNMRFFSPYSATSLPGGPRDFQGRPLRMEFVCVARKIAADGLGFGGSFYVHSADIEDGVVGFGGKKSQGPQKPVSRVVYVL